MKKLFAITFLISFMMTSYSTSTWADSNKVKSVSIMTYNLENLFDSKHDEGKEDWSYMALSDKLNNPEALTYCQSLTNDFYKKTCLELDWSNKVIAEKIKNLSRVISSFQKGGADIIVFQEVENISILKRLASEGLAGHGYKYFSLIEGPDKRGIDVGVMSRFPIVSEKYHEISLKPLSDRPTRGILEVEFKVANKSLTVFANHWPSQGNPDQARVLASRVLKKAALDSKSDIILAAGDFNTLKDDLPHGIQQNILPLFVNIETMARKTFDVPALGTHWYRGTWNSIDKIFVFKKSLQNNLVSIDYSSFEIVSESFMTVDFVWTNRQTGEVIDAVGVPTRFDTSTKIGYSDHLPVGVSLKL